MMFVCLFNDYKPLYIGSIMFCKKETKRLTSAHIPGITHKIMMH